MTPLKPRPIAVIVDVSRSRAHADRAALQRNLLEAFDSVNEVEPGVQLIEPTVGDEFQAVYAGLGQALRATLMARLFLPNQVDCRFGLGSGELRTVGSGVVGAVQDGSAWWSAREAIDAARRHEYSKLSFVRTWFRSLEGPRTSDLGGAEASLNEAIVNSYLLERDHILNSMSARARRLMRGQLLGLTQARLARDEGISQSAVSQSLARSGANAVIASASLMGGISL